jgi:hypothetical protein
VTFATVRENVFPDPRATALNVANFGVRWSGTLSVLTGITDHPAGISTAIRSTAPAAPTNPAGIDHGGNSDLSSGNSGFASGYPVTAGVTYTFSLWVRHNLARGVGLLLRYNDGAAYLTPSASSPTVQLTANTWTRVSVTLLAPAGATRVSIRTDYSAGTAGAWQAGETFDVTGLLLEAAATVGPYFDGATAPALRTNLARNPFAVAGQTGAAAFVYRGTGTANGAVSYLTDAASPVGSTAARLVVGAGSSGWIGISSNGTFATQPGYRYRFSAWVLPSVTRTTTILTRPYGGSPTDAETSFQTGSLMAGEWARLAVTSAAVVNSTGLNLEVRYSSGLPDTMLDTTGWLVEEFGPADVIPTDIPAVFSGDTNTAPDGLAPLWLGAVNASTSVLIDPDLAVAWSGGANASTSLLRGIEFPSGGGSWARAYASTRWAVSGDRSLRMTPIGATADTFTNVKSVPPGRTYRVSAVVRLLAPQTGATASRARAIMIYGYTSGTTTVVQNAPFAMPNVAGEQLVQVTWTAPADAQLASNVTNQPGVMVRLYNGATQGGGDVWWDDLLIEDVTDAA